MTFTSTLQRWTQGTGRKIELKHISGFERFSSTVVVTGITYSTSRRRNLLTCMVKQWRQWRSGAQKGIGLQRAKNVCSICLTYNKKNHFRNVVPVRSGITAPLGA